MNEQTERKLDEFLRLDDMVKYTMERGADFKTWRENTTPLTVEDVATALGYEPEQIEAFEQETMVGTLVTLIHRGYTLVYVLFHATARLNENQRTFEELYETLKSEGKPELASKIIPLPTKR